MAQQPATERLRRLLIILPWLMERGEVAVSEVAERFRIDESSLIRDLELVSLCGLPPYVDELVDVFIDEGTIFVGVPRLFTRPLTLNQVEAFELLAAGRAAMQLPGADPDGPLGRGLRKLAQGLGEDDTGVLVIQPTPETMKALSDAAKMRRRVQVLYDSHGDGEPSTREIEPHQVFSSKGRWYVNAFDSRTNEIRTFRVDRVLSSSDVGAASSPPSSAAAVDDWFADGALERVTLDIGPRGRWVTERYPVDEVSDVEENGWVRVRLAVSNDRWLERLLVRLGPHVRVVEPTRFATLGSTAARRVLERYQPSA